MIKAIPILVLATAAFAPGVFAQEKAGKLDASSPGSATSIQPSTLAEGEVRKVDKDAKKITIKHGPLERLDMPAMTMVFQVRDLAMLDQVKAGDKIRFDAEKVGGAFTLTKIEPAR